MINKISDETIAGILRKSAFGLPDRPSDQGIKAEAIKEALYKPVVDDDYSVVSEMNRIVDEANTELQGIEKETKWFANDFVFENGKTEIAGIGAKVGDLIISTMTGEIGIITAVKDGSETAEKIMDNSVKWFILNTDSTTVSCSSLPDAKVGDWILNSLTGAVMRITAKWEDSNTFVLDKVFNVKGDQGKPGTKWHYIDVKYVSNYATLSGSDYPHLLEGDYVVSSDGSVGIVEEYYEDNGGRWPIRFLFSQKGEHGETGPQGPAGPTGASLLKLELEFEAGTVTCTSQMSDNSTSETSADLSKFVKNIVNEVIDALPKYNGEIVEGET